MVYYDSKGERIYGWQHDWVLAGNELIDGNVDSIIENPKVPDNVRIQPYWGLRKEVPRDRKFHENQGSPTREPDKDVEYIW